MVASTAALALPRSAGAVTLTLSVSPSHPAMPFREDAGIALICSLMVLSPGLGSLVTRRAQWYDESSYHAENQSRADD